MCDKVTTIAKRAKAVVGRRHKVIHDAWTVSEEGEVATHQIGEKFEKNLATQPIDQLERLVRDLRSLRTDAYALANEFKQNPPLTAHSS